ncbi:unnamed protein product [Amoebophrya sp. A120]|nr:unnamed protein product [Amoebophrya sp. A120]|eukprot:GSA120T00025499001.1
MVGRRGRGSTRQEDLVLVADNQGCNPGPQDRPSCSTTRFNIHHTVTIHTRLKDFGMPNLFAPAVMMGRSARLPWTPLCTVRLLGKTCLQRGTYWTWIGRQLKRPSADIVLDLKML